MCFPAGGNSETIVPKKPRNLFMMVDFQRGFGVKAAEDEYNFQVIYLFSHLIRVGIFFLSFMKLVQNSDF
jgi:hypothetical protein